MTSERPSKTAGTGKTFEYKEGEFILHPNDQKTEGDSRPHEKGRGKLNGEIMDIALWRNTSKTSGKPYAKVTISPARMTGS